MSVAKEVTIVQFHPNLSWDANNEFIILTSATEEEHEIAKESCEAPNDDLASLQSYARRIRKGAGKLRAKLLSAYNYKCCISNTGPENVLQAAHIEPHSKSGINHSTNAILLRSDIHDLFDDGLLKIEPKTLIIHVHPKLIGTAYEKYNGVVLAKRSDGLSPDMIKLQERWDFTVWKDI
jgi:predicted restriction endonuclease